AGVGEVLEPSDGLLRTQECESRRADPACRIEPPLDRGTVEIDGRVLPPRLAQRRVQELVAGPRRPRTVVLLVARPRAPSLRVAIEQPSRPSGDVGDVDGAQRGDLGRLLGPRIRGRAPSP